MEYGLVFAGGGVRGAYHIGVWQTLLDLGIEISHVCGTSIGAVNAAMFASGKLDEAIRLWESISLYDIVRLPDDTKITEDLFKAKTITALLKHIFSQKGLEMQPFEKLLNAIIDEEQIRNSKIKLGLTAFSLTDKKLLCVGTDEIPRGQLVDYLMASVCLIGFKSRKISGKNLIDAGFSNNMPVDFMVKRNIKNILTVNAKGIGLYRDQNLAGRNVIEIKCRTPYTGTMDFDRNGILKSIENGRLDARRTFGLLGGNIYYFNAEQFRKLHFKYSSEIIEGIEAAAEIIGIDKLSVYDFDELLELVLTAYEQDKAPALLYAAVKTLKGDGFIEKKLDNVLGNYYLAASAIMYFKNK